MAVYDINGNSILTVYDKNGELQYQVYDIDGTPLLPSNFKVMSFNVGVFYSEWHPAPADTGDTFYLRNKDIFENADADFAGLTEWYNQIGTVPASTLMNEFFSHWYPDYTPYPGNANAAMTSAFKMLPSNVILVRYTNQGSETRYYQKSYIPIGNKTVCFITTHLDQQDAAKAAQFLELMAAVENEEYFIITGDFNFSIQNVGDSAYNQSVKIALDMGFNSAQNADNLFMTWYSGETAETSGAYALDNIITSANISINSVQVDTTKLTDGLCTQYNIIIDHLPLIAEITI